MMQSKHNQQHRRQRGFTLMELMYVVFIIGVAMSVGLPVLVDLLDRARTARIFPYAKVSMEYLAGYHSIYGDWPNEIESPFHPPGAPPAIDVVGLAQGKWPSAMAGIENQPVWIEGSVATHDGSFLMTSNIIDRAKPETIVFYLRPLLHEGTPTNFVWDCANRRESEQALPNPTTIRSDALPYICQPPRGDAELER